MRSQAQCYDELRAFAEKTPLVDCHDHTSVPGPKYTDPLHVVLNGYYPSDMHTMAGDDHIFLAVMDCSKPLEERWAIFEPIWRRACHTGYAQVSRRVLKKFYGESELSLEALYRMREKLPDYEDEALFDSVLGEAGIAVRLMDSCGNPGVLKGVFSGDLKLPPRARMVIPLPGYHAIRCAQDAALCMHPVDQWPGSLDDYLAGCRTIFERHKAQGAVAFKDQSAYSRTLAYSNPTRAEAEEIFNWFMADHRRAAAYPDGVKPLDDYLFHQFMRMAREMELPVQVHTGHMAGIRNEITKTNAVQMSSVFELHPEVKFDLFHANWPYSGELLFLAKNYPNVHIDLCWANIIDPIYCQNLLKQAVSAVPHGKIHGYGSDFGGNPDGAWAHASIARDNIAIALADLVEMEYMSLDEAKEVARSWMFDNANNFFKLNAQG